MAILGYNTKGASASSAADNRCYVSSATLSTGGTLTELHAWVSSSSPTTQLQLVVYSDTAGSPDVLKAYTTPITMTNTFPTIVEIAQTGLSVALTAGTYWLGFASVGSSTDIQYDATGPWKGATSGFAFNPPQSPFGTVNASGTRQHSVWGVVNTSSSWTGSSTVSLTATVTTAGTVSTPILGASTVSETVTITTSGVVRMGIVPKTPGSLSLTPKTSGSFTLTPKPPS